METKLELLDAGHDEIYNVLAKYQIKNPRCGAGCGMGWIPLIESLINELIAAGWDKDCQQIKEKFGGLRFYIGKTDEGLSAIISWYENLSMKTCEACGAVGKRVNNKGWVKTLCEEHTESE